MQHQLRLEPQAAVAPEPDRIEVVADKEAIAILVVGIGGPAYFLLANGGVDNRGQGHLAIEQYLRPATLDLGHPFVVHDGHHLAGNAPGGRRGEGIVGEGHLFGCPALGLNFYLGALEAHTANRAPPDRGWTVPIASTVERIVGVDNGVKIDLQLGAPALLIGHVAHPLLSCSELFRFARARC